MSIDMTKKAAEVSLVKHMTASQEAGNDPGDIEMQVEMYVDTSTSMTYRYGGKPSEMQVTVTRNLALALTGLDEDENIPLYAFDNGVRYIGVATETNYETILSDWLKSNGLYPATNFLPIYQQVMESFLGAPEDNDYANRTPRLVLIHTDGVPADQVAFKKAIIEAAKYPIFWIFTGHGQSLEFLEDLDTMGGRVVDNVALIELDDARNWPDEKYFDKLTEELITSWYPAIRKAGITNK